MHLAGHSHIMAQIISSVANLPRTEELTSLSHHRKRRRQELSSFKEALLSAMCSSDEEEP